MNERKKYLIRDIYGEREKVIALTEDQMHFFEWLVDNDYVEDIEIISIDKFNPITI